ncbi:phage tail assembly protein [Streptomyces sp. NPDC039016]|uniref:phage tail assembly protein n=1 Tax=Streptomyces sp. NPDC039016 TaxID=3154330 RepID=UPI0033FAD7E7
MAEPVSIAHLRTEAQTTYEALPVLLDSGAVVGLRSVLMLDEDEDNAAVEKLLGEITTAGSENRLDAVKGAMRRLLLTVADDRALLEPELATWELGVLMGLIERWQAGTQVPEASSSAS